jgi:hypothetical protein
MLMIFSLVAVIVILSTGCSRIKGRNEDKSYLTPIPYAALDAYEFGQPVKTKLQAVMAARKGDLTFHTHEVGWPPAIFVESMDYQEAIRRVEQPGTSSYVDPNLSHAPVWLVVLKGKWTITDPSGKDIGPISGCGYAVVDAKDGDKWEAGILACEKLNLHP